MSKNLYSDLASTLQTCNKVIKAYKYYVSLSNKNKSEMVDEINNCNEIVWEFKRILTANEFTDDFIELNENIFSHFKKNREFLNKNLHDFKKSPLLQIIVYLIRGVFINFHNKVLINVPSERQHTMYEFLPDPSSNEVRNSLKDDLHKIFISYEPIYSEKITVLDNPIHTIKTLILAPFRSKTHFYFSVLNVLKRYFIDVKIGQPTMYEERLQPFRTPNKQTKLIVEIVSLLYKHGSHPDINLNTQVISDLAYIIRPINDAINQIKQKRKNGSYPFFENKTEEMGDFYQGRMQIDNMEC